MTINSRLYNWALSLKAVYHVESRRYSNSKKQVSSETHIRDRYILLRGAERSLVSAILGDKPDDESILKWYEAQKLIQNVCNNCRDNVSGVMDAEVIANHEECKSLLNTYHSANVVLFNKLQEKYPKTLFIKPKVLEKLVNGRSAVKFTRARM